MTYKIISISQASDSVITTVQYTLNNDVIVTTDVAHFRPQTLEDIDANLKNRALSEQAALDATTSVSILFPTIVTGETITF